MGTELIWEGSIALDFFLGGIGVGTFLYAVAVSFINGGKYNEVSKVGALLTPICVVVGLLFLIGHLGQPFHFYHIFLTVKITSPIWWGAWLQTIFVVISIVYAFMWMKDMEKVSFLPSFMSSRNAIGVIGVPFALAVGCYHGFMLMVFKSKPLWNSGPIMVSAICGFVMTGIALVILVLSLSKKNKELIKSLRLSRDVLGGVIIVQLFTIFLWVSSMYFGDMEGKNAMNTLLSDFGMLFWGGVVAIGLVLPLLIGAGAVIREKSTGKFSLLVPLVVSVLVLIGGLAMRYVIIIAGQA